MKHLEPIFMAIVLATTFSINAQNPDTHSITAHINGVKNIGGVIRAFLFNSEDGFLTKTYMEITAEAKSKDALTLIFDKLPLGDYALNVYHDENNNNELDSNWVGIPKEPYGFSNNVRGNMGPPQFEEAKFSLNNSNEVISINIK